LTIQYTSVSEIGMFPNEVYAQAQNSPTLQDKWPLGWYLSKFKMIFDQRDMSSESNAYIIR